MSLKQWGFPHQEKQEGTEQMHAGERGIWNITISPLDLKIDFLKQQLPMKGGGIHAKNQADTFIVTGQRNTTMVGKATLKTVILHLFLKI